MSKHTPGPWPLEYSGDGKRLFIGYKAFFGQWVAEVDFDDPPEHLTAIANASLIASSPELLSACKIALKYGRVIDGFPAFVVDTLRSAINKAERNTGVKVS